MNYNSNCPVIFENLLVFFRGWNVSFNRIIQFRECFGFSLAFLCFGKEWRTLSSSSVTTNWALSSWSFGLLPETLGVLPQWLYCLLLLAVTWIGISFCFLHSRKKHEPCKRSWCYTVEPCMQPTATLTLVPKLLLCTVYTDCHCIVQSVQYQLRLLDK